MALKKRTPNRPSTPTPPAPQVAEAPKAVTPAPTPIPARPAPRRPAPPAPKKAPPKAVPKPTPPVPKEVSNVGTQETKKPVQEPKRASAEAPKPIASEGRQSTPSEPRPTHQRPQAERVAYSEAMRSMTLEERTKLFKELNVGQSDRFVPILKELPKKLGLRLDEAIERKLVDKKKPKAPSGFTPYYCPYCIDWQAFYKHSFSGYMKCTGCGMSTHDFYTRSDNQLFGVDT